MIEVNKATALFVVGSENRALIKDIIISSDAGVPMWERQSYQGKSIYNSNRSVNTQLLLVSTMLILICDVS